MTKKIIIFSTNYFPFVGGAEVAIKEITDRSNTKEFAFDMIVPKYTPTNKRFEKLGNINVYRVGFGIKLDKFLIPFLGYSKAKQLEKKNKYNVIWSMMASQASIAAAKFKNKFPNKRLVLTLQEGDEESHLKRYVFGNDFLYKLLIKPFYLKVFKAADHITAISNYLILRGERNSKNTPTTLIPNGVDIKRFTKNDGNLGELKRDLGIKDNEKVIITTSRLVKKNGVEDLITSIQYLQTNIKLLIVGSGELENTLKQKTKTLGVDGRAIFVGNISQSEIPKYLYISDIFVRPSLSEGQGVSFIEAMAAEVPIIATPVGGIPDFLEDQKTGLFCNVNDPKSIANDVTKLLEDKDLTNKIKVSARRLVEDKYDWDNLAEKFLKTLSH